MSGLAPGGTWTDPPHPGPGQNRVSTSKPVSRSRCAAGKAGVWTTRMTQKLQDKQAGALLRMVSHSFLFFVFLNFSLIKMKVVGFQCTSRRLAVRTRVAGFPRLVHHASASSHFVLGVGLCLARTFTFYSLGQCQSCCSVTSYGRQVQGQTLRSRAPYSGGFAPLD